MSLALRVAVSLAVLAALAVLLPWDLVVDAATRLSWPVWAGVLVAFLAGHRLGVEKWRLLVGASGSVGLSSTAATRAYAAGLFTNLFLPTIVGGDVLRAVLASKATGRGEPVVLAGLADRIADVAALALLLGAGAALAGATLPGGNPGVVALAALAGGALAGALLLALLRRPIAAWPPRLRRPVGRGLVALRRLRARPGRAAAAFLLSFAIQGGFVLLNAWIGASVGIDVPLAVWLFAWPLAKIVAMIPISLGGLGVRDATLGGLLTAWGVPMATGVVASLVWQSVVYAGGLLAGGYWALARRGEAAVG